jgi:hypothetical protein
LASAAADNRSKKEKLKDAILAKDAAMNSNSMLDAYSAAPVVVAPASPSPVVVEVKVEAEVEEGEEKDWEAMLDVTPALPVAPVAPVVRRLVPGGGGSAGKALNAGPAAASKVKSSYPKAELMKLRPAEFTEADRPDALSCYISIKSKGGGGAGPPGQGSSGDGQKGGGAWNRGEMKGGQGPTGQVLERALL